MCACSLSSALSSASKPGVIATVRHRFHERAEACASVLKATEEARVEKENRIQADKARLEKETALRDEVRASQDPCYLGSVVAATFRG